MKILHLIANTKSGKGRGAEIPGLARAACAEHGAQLVHHASVTPTEFATEIKEAVRQAGSDGGIVVAAGGDGTLRAVAEECVKAGVTFAAVPMGTFNLFARGHRIPEDPSEALRLALTGRARGVRLGQINGHVFLINASLGLYAKAIHERKARTLRWGRNRIVVVISTILSLLSKHRLLDVEMVREGERRRLRTPMIFIGNNALQLRDLKMDVAACMKENRLALVLLKPVRKLEILRVIFRGILKTLEKDSKLDTFCVDELTIHTSKPRQHVALDGEMFKLVSPFRVRALPECLNMILPEVESSHVQDDQTEGEVQGETR